MANRRLDRITADMKRYGVVRTVGVALGRVCTKDRHVPIFSPIGCVIGGDGIADAADQFELSPEALTNAIRFALKYPLYDSPAFWKGLPDQMPPKEGSRG